LGEWRRDVRRERDPDVAAACAEPGPRTTGDVAARSLDREEARAPSGSGARNFSDGVTPSGAMEMNQSRETTK